MEANHNRSAVAETKKKVVVWTRGREAASSSKLVPCVIGLCDDYNKYSRKLQICTVSILVQTKKQEVIQEMANGVGE